MSDERLYTEAQARIWGLREVCRRLGHTIDRHYSEHNDGRGPVVDDYVCVHCDVMFRFDYPDLPDASHATPSP